MLARARRKQRGWAQEQLANMCGLSDLNSGAQESAMSCNGLDRERVSGFVKARRIFRDLIVVYSFVVSLLLIETITSPLGAGFAELIEVAAPWGMAVVLHWLYLLKVRSELFSAEWETQRILNSQ